MKKCIYTLCLFTTLALLITSCAGSKKIQKTTGAKEIELPLSGKEYKSDSKFFRAVQSGLSENLATAKKIALLNAKTELAGNVQSLIKNVTDQYTNQRSIGNAQEYESKFEELSREVVQQNLTDVKIIEEKVLQEQNNSYTYWIAIEVSKESILNGIDESISKDESMKLDFDKFQYQKIFDEEMKKFEESQN